MGLFPVLGLIGLALAFGFLGLSVVFTGLAPDESFGERAATAGVFYFFSAAVIGYLNPRLWLVGMLTAWGGVFLGFPIAVALVGARVGALLKTQRIIPRLIARLFPSD